VCLDGVAGVCVCVRKKPAASSYGVKIRSTDAPIAAYMMMMMRRRSH